MYVCEETATVGRLMTIHFSHWPIWLYCIIRWRFTYALYLMAMTVHLCIDISGLFDDGPLEHCPLWRWSDIRWWSTSTINFMTMVEHPIVVRLYSWAFPSKWACSNFVAISMATANVIWHSSLTLTLVEWREPCSEYDRNWNFWIGFVSVAVSL